MPGKLLTRRNHLRVSARSSVTSCVPVNSAKRSRVAATAACCRARYERQAAAGHALAPTIGTCHRFPTGALVFGGDLVVKLLNQGANAGTIQVNRAR